MMNTIIFDLLDTCVVIYLDDLLIFSKTVEEYQNVLDVVFVHLAKHQLYLRPNKYTLLLKHVQSLGYVLDASFVYSKVRLMQLLSSLNPPVLPICSNFLDLVTIFVSLSKVMPGLLLPLLNFFIAQIPHLYLESLNMQPSLPLSLPQLQPQYLASLTLLFHPSSQLTHLPLMPALSWSNSTLWLVPSGVLQQVAEFNRN